jgi:hypothetical protein
MWHLRLYSIQQEHVKKPEWAPQPQHQNGVSVNIVGGDVVRVYPCLRALLPVCSGTYPSDGADVRSSFIPEMASLSFTT